MNKQRSTLIATKLISDKSYLIFSSQICVDLASPYRFFFNLRKTYQPQLLLTFLGTSTNIFFSFWISTWVKAFLNSIILQFWNIEYIEKLTSTSLWPTWPEENTYLRLQGIISSGKTFFIYSSVLWSFWYYNICSCFTCNSLFLKVYCDKQHVSIVSHYEEICCSWQQISLLQTFNFPFL